MHAASSQSAAQASNSLDPQIIEAWRRRIRTDTEANYHCEMGRAIAAEGNLQAAVEAFRRALKIKPDYPEASWQLVGVLRRLGDNNGAETAHAAALAIQANYAAVGLERLGRQAFIEGKMDRAIEHLDQAAQLDPTLPGAVLWRDLARAAHRHTALSDVPNALIARLSPDDAVELADEHTRVARDLTNKLLLPLAESVARRGAALDPLSDKAVYLVAILLFRGANYAEAAIWSRRALSIAPGSAALLVQAGLGSCFSDDFQGGEIMLRRATIVDPKDMTSFGNLGFALRRQRKFGEALAALRRAAELPPPTGWIYGEMGRAYREMGDLERSGDAYRHGVALASGVPGYEWLQTELDEVLQSRR